MSHTVSICILGGILSTIHAADNQHKTKPIWNIKGKYSNEEATPKISNSTGFPIKVRMIVVGKQRIMIQKTPAEDEIIELPLKYHTQWEQIDVDKSVKLAIPICRYTPIPCAPTITGVYYEKESTFLSVRAVDRTKRAKIKNKKFTNPLEDDEWRIDDWVFSIGLYNNNAFEYELRKKR